MLNTFPRQLTAAAVVWGVAGGACGGHALLLVLQGAAVWRWRCSLPQPPSFQYRTPHPPASPQGIRQMDTLLVHTIMMRAKQTDANFVSNQHICSITFKVIISFNLYYINPDIRYILSNNIIRKHWNHQYCNAELNSLPHWHSRSRRLVQCACFSPGHDCNNSSFSCVRRFYYSFYDLNATLLLNNLDIA